VTTVVDTRPVPGTPRPYEFPAFVRDRLSNGIALFVVDLPGRPLISTSLVARSGAADEPDAVAGSALLGARALSEGTERFDAIALVEASERLGASLHAEAGWDATSAGVDVPAERFEPALELLAEMVAHPTFPAAEVERLRDERLNDLLQARADPRRRADEAFVETIYSPASPYHRPAGGTRESVATLDPDRLRETYRRAVDPARTAIIVAGDVSGIDVPAVAERLFGSLRREIAAIDGAIVDDGAVDERFVRVVHRPGAVQTEIRIGHRGLSRRTPDFHALSVMGAILGGLFNSRLNMKLREEKGYTYGAGAGFDLRRAAGPFSARAAVNTEATVDAVGDFLREIARMRDDRVTDAELKAAKDFLVGVFPLRFETPGPVAGALSGIHVHQLPDDELARYRPAIEAVTVDDVARVAREHLRPEQAAVVLVGDADTFGVELERAGYGPVSVERDAGPIAEGPLEDEVGPVDRGHDGPTEGAENPDEADATDGPAEPGGTSDEAIDDR
jgi:predicted Zn-dependent peptidase